MTLIGIYLKFRMCHHLPTTGKVAFGTFFTAQLLNLLVYAVMLLLQRYETVVSTCLMLKMA